MNFSERLFVAAVAWWEGQRPIDFSKDDHHKNPVINCVNETERELGRSVSEALEGINE